MSKPVTEGDGAGANKGKQSDEKKANADSGKVVNLMAGVYQACKSRPVVKIADTQAIPTGSPIRFPAPTTFTVRRLRSSSLRFSSTSRSRRLRLLATVCTLELTGTQHPWLVSLRGSRCTHRCCPAQLIRLETEHQDHSGPAQSPRCPNQRDERAYWRHHLYQSKFRSRRGLTTQFFAWSAQWKERAMTARTAEMKQMIRGEKHPYTWPCNC